MNNQRTKKKCILHAKQHQFFFYLKCSDEIWYILMDISRSRGKTHDRNQNKLHFHQDLIIRFVELTK